MSRNAPASALYRVTLEVCDREYHGRDEVTLLTRDLRQAHVLLEERFGRTYEPPESWRDFERLELTTALCGECGIVHHVDQLALEDDLGTDRLWCLWCAESCGACDWSDFPFLVVQCAGCGEDCDLRDADERGGLCDACAKSAEEDSRRIHESAHAAGAL